MINEVDYNHPDYPGKTSENNVATEVQLGENDALYIYVPNPHQIPPQRFQLRLDKIKTQFEEKIPNTIIMVGGSKLEFTIITKKKVFAHKLAGNIKEK